MSQRVLIAGGGFAALEAGLALRALAGERVALSLVSPEPIMRYRPAASVEATTSRPDRAYAWADVAGDLGAEHRLARLESVAPQQRWVRLSTGERLPYDALILAVGARGVASVPGALVFRDQRDLAAIRRALDGPWESLVFAVPPGTSWPLPIYELALASSVQARRSGTSGAVSIVTPERAPLEVFGDRASAAVRALLDDHEVHVLRGATPKAVRRDGSLELEAGGALAADAVVTVPELRGHRVSGVPANWWGFVPTDARGLVAGLRDVYAAGDICAFPVKHGGLAAQQADRIAHTIADGLGLGLHEADRRIVLEARLAGGDRVLHLRTELDWQGRPTGASQQRREVEPATTKVFGRYLAPYLQQRMPLVL